MNRVECVVVLGLILDDDGGLKWPLKSRLDRAYSFIASLLDQRSASSGRPTVLVVLTGGFPAPKPLSEAQAMKNYLEQTHPKNVEWQAQGLVELILDEEALNTIENAYFSKQLLLRRLKALQQEQGQMDQDDQQQVVNCTVITSDFHLPRSSLIFTQVFNAVYDLGREYKPLKRLRDEKHLKFPPPPPEVLFDLAFLGPPTPREHCNPSEVEFLKTCPANLGMYEARYPSGDLSRTPTGFFHYLRDGWLKGVSETWRTQPDCIEWRENGWSPLHVAASHGHYNLVDFLLAKGADPNLPLDDENSTGLTPLHLAAEKLYVEIAHLLLLSGAKASLTKAAGVREKRTPIALCRELEVDNTEQPRLSALRFLLDPALHSWSPSPRLFTHPPNDGSGTSFLKRLRSGSGSGGKGSPREDPNGESRKKLLFLLRHGQSMANAHHNAMDGVVDVILSENGRRLCENLGLLLNEPRKPSNNHHQENGVVGWRSVLEEMAPTLVVVSPLSRAIQTYVNVVEPYVKKAGKGKVRTVINADLRERMCHSSDIGTPTSRLRKLYPHLDFSKISEHWWHIPESKTKTVRPNTEFVTEKEPDSSLRERLGRFKRWLQEQPEERVLIVSHYFTLTGLCEELGTEGNFMNNLCTEILEF